MSNVFDRVLVAGFTLLLFHCLSRYLSTQASEKMSCRRTGYWRRLPSLPARFSDVELPGKFEDYYKDNFGLRVPLLAISTTPKLATGVTANSVPCPEKDS
ncbi:MAG: hypothetical protein IPG64_23465 [Haliea sp.]|nr:hypothetical protein [Haliea sp.]